MGCECISVEGCRIESMCQQIYDMVTVGQLDRTTAISLINNLADEDRADDETDIDFIVTRWSNMLALN